MRNRPKRCLLVAAAVLFALLLGACADAAAIGEDDSQIIQEIGDAFMEDLRNVIIPAREDPEQLVDKGYALAASDQSYGMDAVIEFAASYDVSDDSQVTIIFSDTSFLVARIVFIDGRGYYLRYRYDQFNPKDISVSAQLVDTVEFTYQETPPRWEMKLLYEKKEVVPLFRFSNPDVGGE